ncbi:MAG: outer membrane beta-barrel protein [Bacteroidota bacterium]
MKFLLITLGIAASLGAAAQSDSTRHWVKDTIYTPKWTITIQRNTEKSLPGSANLGRKDRNWHQKHTKKKGYGGGIDIGWSNYQDNTNYTQAAFSGDVASGITSSDLKLKLGSSRNINLWLIMDEAPLIKKTLQLQYGFGLELNNYYLDSKNVYFAKNPTYLYATTTPYKKAKLAADYISVPLLVKLNLTPHRKNNPFTIAGGVSGGFLYSARFKTKNSGDITKIRSDFDLERFKFSYVGELGLGPIKLYGSYAMKDMFRNELNMTPYAVGFRFVD